MQKNKRTLAVLIAVLAICLSSAIVLPAQARINVPARLDIPTEVTFSQSYTQNGTYFGYTWVQATLSVTYYYNSRGQVVQISYSNSTAHYELSAADVYAGMTRSPVLASLYADGDGMTLKVIEYYQIINRKAVGYEYDYAFVHWSQTNMTFTCWGYSITSGV